MPTINNGDILANQYVGGAKVSATMVNATPATADYVITSNGQKLKIISTPALATVSVPANWIPPLVLKTNAGWTGSKVTHVRGTVWTLEATNLYGSTFGDSQGNSVLFT